MPKSGLYTFKPPRTHRPTVMGQTHMVAAGHYLAAAAGFRILEAGGNAVDAGVAAGICINVLQSDMTNFGGVAPIILYLAESREVVTISGLGRWPKKASVAFFKEHCGGDIPSGVLRSVTPAAAGAWLLALERFGTLPFSEVVAPALELAGRGFPMHQFLHDNLVTNRDDVARFPLNARIFLPGGVPPPVGQIVRQPELANTFRRLIAVEAKSGPREAGLRAAREFFYKGDIARAMAEFSRSQGGLMEYDDIANFSVRLEAPVKTTYRGYEVYSCGPWCQGPTLPEALNILEGYDLKALGHNTAEYLHLVVSALDAAFADRHAYVADPDFVRVPVEGLLSKEYAAAWRQRISDRAWREMPTPGDPWKYQRAPQAATAAPVGAHALRVAPELDTSYACAIDRWGNGFSATPSDGVTETPLIPELGIIMSSRGAQSWVDEQHPARIEGGKRPRLTPSPHLVLKDDQLELVIGTPGADAQPQAMAQVLLNMFEFDMDPQQAIEQPRVVSYNYPGSGHPHAYHPGTMRAEARIPAEVCDRLRAMGHTVERWPEWIGTAGAPCVVRVDREKGILMGGGDPRRMSYVVGW